MVWEEHETYVCYPDTQCEHVFTDIFPLNYPIVYELSHTSNVWAITIDTQTTLFATITWHHQNHLAPSKKMPTPEKGERIRVRKKPKAP